MLARPKFARWSADGRAAAYVAAFTAGSERHPGLTEVSPSVRDPADDYLVALAREAHADPVPTAITWRPAARADATPGTESSNATVACASTSSNSTAWR